MKRDIQKILKDHELWLRSGTVEGQKANLRGADLRGANLQETNLQETNLQWANLRGADLRESNLQETDLQETNLREADLRESNLRGANLQDTNLQDTNLQGADLREAKFDFSVFPLWCGSFGMKVDDRLIEQLFCHIHRLDIEDCSDEIKRIIKLTNSLKNEFCKRRGDVGKI